MRITVASGLLRLTLVGEYNALKDKSDVLVPPETFKDWNNVTLEKFVQDLPVISINRDEVSNIRSEPADEVIKKLQALKPQVDAIIGEKKFTCEKNSQRVEERISEGIRRRIEKNVRFRHGMAIKENKLEKAVRELFRFRLGNAIVKDRLEEAINALHERDIKQKQKQIYIPELFIGETPFDYDKLCEQLNARANDENFSDKEKEHWVSKKENIKQEAVERNAYETLKDFFKNDEDHEVSVFHGYELMDLTEGAAYQKTYN